jgi:hypothetical protein
MGDTFRCIPPLYLPVYLNYETFIPPYEKNQGKAGLYTNFRAVTEKRITKAREEKWIAFFKTGKVVNL